MLREKWEYVIIVLRIILKKWEVILVKISEYEKEELKINYIWIWEKIKIKIIYLF